MSGFESAGLLNATAAPGRSRPCGGGSAHQSRFVGEQGGSSARTDTELAIEVLYMRPGRARRDPEFLSNFLLERPLARCQRTSRSAGADPAAGAGRAWLIGRTGRSTPLRRCDTHALFKSTLEGGLGLVPDPARHGRRGSRRIPQLVGGQSHADVGEQVTS
jgi:hypothetical protein